VQIPKAQKETDDLTVFFALLESARIKAAHKHVGEIDGQAFCKHMILQNPKQ